MATLWQDIRYALRMLMRSPGFTIVVVLILTLGIGANTAIFSIVNAVLLRPLPFADPDRVVQIATRSASGRTNIYNSMSDCVAIQQRCRAFETVAAISHRYFMDVSSDGPRGIGVAGVPASFFDVVGVQPVLGRGFRPDEERPGEDRVVVLSHQCWTENFGASPDVLGQNITLQEGIHTRQGMEFKEGIYTVVGVMPADFWCLDQRRLWIPLVSTTEQSSACLIARLKPQIKLEQAQAEMDVISGQLAQEQPRTSGNRSFLLVSPRERLVADVRPTLWILFGIVGFVLAVACANVSGMLLARSMGRRRELTVRIALGAQRLRLIRQYLTEGLLLSLAGGFCALLLTSGLLGVMNASLPSSIPRISEINIDDSVFSFALVVSVLVGTLIGLVPVLRTADMDTSRILKQSSQTIRGGRTLHKALLVSEIALSLMLLVGAGLMIRSFWRLTSVDLGFDPENLLVTNVESEGSIIEEPRLYLQTLADRVRQLPGVQTVAYGNLRLFGGAAPNSFALPGQDISPDGQGPVANFIDISEDYFMALRVPLVAGRHFTDDDRAGAEPVVVVNQTLTRRYLPDEPTVGRTVICRHNACRIVGVVGDVRPNGFRSDVTPTMYFPYRQVPGLSRTRLIVRTASKPVAVLKSLHQEILALSPHRPVEQIRTVDGILSRRTAPMRFNMWLLSLFATLALILASVGIYGLMAFFVSQRTQEIGVRMALGARSADVLRAVLRQGLKLTLIGLTIGIAGACAATQVIRAFLYDVSPTDPLTFACVAGLLALATLLACYIPARRAAKIDPMEALRYE